MKQLTRSLLMAAAVCAYAQAQEIISPGQPPRIPPQPPTTTAGYIVTFAPGTSKNARAIAAMGAGAQIRFNYDSIEAIAIQVANENALNALRNHPNVVRITKDRVITIAAKGGNGGGGNNGGTAPTPLTFDTRQVITAEVQRVGIPSTGSDGTGIGVAVLDTGIDYTHPDLNPAPNGTGTAFNAITPGGSAQDDAGHGAHVSGLIAAQNNTTGMLGVAPGARLYGVKVLNNVGAGSDATVMAGLDWVVQNYNRVTPPIRIVNMSLGRPLATSEGETLDNSATRPLIQQLYSRGIVVVAAAGNSPQYEINLLVPSGFPEVLAVGSIVTMTGIRVCYLFGNPSYTPVFADTAAGTTSDGAGVTISAPGEERTDIVNLGSSGCVALEYGVLSTSNTTGGITRKLVPLLAEARGTSFAAPLVTGAIARVMQKQLVPATANGAEVEGIRNWIKSNASRGGETPIPHPWGGLYPYESTTADGVKEGIAQAPK